MRNVFCWFIIWTLLLILAGRAESADVCQPKLPIEIPVLVMEYFPVTGDRIDRTVTGDWEESLAETRRKTTLQTEQVVQALQEGSRYHGYKDKTARPSLVYKVVETVECLERLPTVAKSGPGAPMKVYVSTDMEGCSGVTCSEQVAGEEGKRLMAEDMNACIQGCFAAGATEVIVWDGHGSGRNVNPQLIDRRAKLIRGSAKGKRFKDIEGSAAIILLGYHAKALTPNATLAHTYSSASIQGMWLNGREVGEVGVDAAIAAEYKVPVVMVAGDDKVCAEAQAWIPGVVTCQTKKGTGPQSAEVLPLEESHRRIVLKTKEALTKRNEIQPITIDHPATIRWDYLPKGSLRTHNPKFKPVDNPRRVEKTGDSVEALLVGK
jgi:D-amino peptidase